MKEDMPNQYYNVERSIYDSFNNDYRYVKQKKKQKNIIIPILVVLLFVVLIFIFKPIFGRTNGKNRTFMIYMVGSDLESKSKQGTYSISDIVGENIDLKNNNVLLMVGGAEKWHNFVDKDEIGFYELTKTGFVKKKSFPLESMGTSATLEKFLDYSYQNYPADKFDMIFWNHGLGAIGIEQDEVSKDYLSISELNSAFRNSAFNSEKLETTIFYNCLASNIHIANIMKKYSKYMVASEEIFYLSKSLKRLNFLEEVKTDDDGYDIGYHFIKQSDKVVNEYNNSHVKNIDSTLSIIDLEEIDDLYSKLNSFIKTIDIDKNYYDIANYRRNTRTYGITQTYDYDMVDLYDMVDNLGKLSKNNDMKDKILSKISDVIKYTSNLDSSSNGISVYFPFFGKDSSIETHLTTFEKTFNDDYYSFINDFYQIRSGVRRNSGGYNKLTNDINTEDGYITLEMSDKERENIGEANIYLFSKKDEKYNLLLEHDNIGRVGNKVMFSPIYNKLLSVNGNIVSYNTDITYGRLSDGNDELNVKFDVSVNMIGPNDVNGVEIKEAILDSNEYISSSIVDINDYSKISFAKINYKLFENGVFNKDFKDTKELEYIETDKNNLNISYVNNQEIEYYALIEIQDIYGEVYYSNLKLIN